MSALACIANLAYASLSARPPTPRPAIPSEAGNLIDVVDGKDRVIGNATFADVHRLAGLTHRGCHVFVLDRHCRTLLQRRTADAYNWPSRWSWFGEHSLLGEGYLACAQRLLVEELQMTAEGAHQARLTTVRNATRFFSREGKPGSFDDLFLVQYAIVLDQAAAGTVQVSAEESTGQRWITLPEWERWMRAKPDAFLHYEPSLVPPLADLEKACRMAPQ